MIMKMYYLSKQMQRQRLNIICCLSKIYIKHELKFPLYEKICQTVYPP